MTRISKEDLAYIQQNTEDICKRLNGRKILLTGGTGFFGKWLLEFFLYAIEELSLDIQVYILSRNPEAFFSRYPHLVNKPHFTFCTGDITDFSFSGIEADIIIHAATEASAKLNHEKPLAMIDSIVAGTRNVLEFAQRSHTERMLCISSGGVYGVQPDGLAGFGEDFPGGPDPLKPASAYAEAKRMAELLCACYAKQYKIEIPVARCFAFVGPYLDLDTHFAVGNFIRNGLNGETITIKGNGKPLRSYMYPSDLVIWLLHILMLGKSTEAYNVGSGEAVSIKDLAYKVASFFPGLKVDVLNQTNPTDRNQNYVPDIQKTLHCFNLKHPLALEDSLLKTIDFHRRTNDQRSHF